MSFQVTLMIIPEGEIVENSAYDLLIKACPTAGTHDQINRVFPLALDGINSILVDEITDSEGEKLTGDDQLAAVATLLFSEDRSRPIQLSNTDLDRLFKHPTYQLYAGNFDSLEKLNDIYSALFGSELSGDLATAKDQARIDVKSYFMG